MYFGNFIRLTNITLFHICTENSANIRPSVRSSSAGSFDATFDRGRCIPVSDNTPFSIYVHTGLGRTFFSPLVIGVVFLT